MNPSPQPSVSLSEGFEAQQLRYRAVSKLAVSALVFGGLSFTALIHPLLWLTPVVALLLCGLALWDIARSDRVLTGRRCAVWGLALAMFFGAAGPAKWAGYRWLIRREARQVADEWWQHIEADEPEKAFQLTVLPHLRQPRDETIWEFYRSNPESAEELHEYVKPESLVRTLLELRKQGASFRYYSSEGQESRGTRDWVVVVHAVTYEQQGKKKTFFVRLQLKRYRSFRTGGGLWQIEQMFGGVKPEVRME